MIFGLSTPTYTIVHVAISLIAILSGAAVLLGMLQNRRLDRMTLVFILFATLTNLTGFGFPITGRTPAIVLGLISSVVLLICIPARYVFRMRGAWRPVYIVTAVMALWFNVFVLIAQSFQKIAPLQALAPTGSEPAFVIAQVTVLVLFILTGSMAVTRFRP